MTADMPAQCALGKNGFSTESPAHSPLLTPSATPAPASLTLAVLAPAGSLCSSPAAGNCNACLAYTAVQALPYNSLRMQTPPQPSSVAALSPAHNTDTR